jgi:hypothetical protein
LTSFLAEFIEDFAIDGKLDNIELQSRIAQDAQFVDVGSIRKNLTKFYSDTLFNDFHKYIHNFILHTDFQPNIKLSFPETTSLGRNLFSMLDNSFLSKDSVYSACIDLSNVNLCSDCFWIRIEIVKVSESGEFNVEIYDTNWDVWCQDPNHCSFQFYQGISNYSIPALITFKDHGEAMLTFQLYFTSNNENHVWSKNIKW